MKKYSVVLSGLLIICSTYLLAQKKQPHRYPGVSKNASGSSMAVSIANGKKVYTQYCISCHQADGGGVQNMNPPLIKTTYVLGDKGKLVSILQNGFKENVEINGDTYSNNMPSFNYLKDQEIADVLTFVRNSFGNKASMVSLKEVAPLRAAASKK